MEMSTPRRTREKEATLETFLAFGLVEARESINGFQKVSPVNCKGIRSDIAGQGTAVKKANGSTGDNGSLGFELALSTSLSEPWRSGCRRLFGGGASSWELHSPMHLSNKKA